jgi:hypothetical protein
MLGGQEQGAPPCESSCGHSGLWLREAGREVSAGPTATRQGGRIVAHPLAQVTDLFDEAHSGHQAHNGCKLGQPDWLRQGRLTAPWTLLHAGAPNAGSSQPLLVAARQKSTECPSLER